MLSLWVPTVASVHCQGKRALRDVVTVTRLHLKALRGQRGIRPTHGDVCKTVGRQTKVQREVLLHSVVAVTAPHFLRLGDATRRHADPRSNGAAVGVGAAREAELNEIFESTKTSGIDSPSL